MRQTRTSVRLGPRETSPQWREHLDWRANVTARDNPDHLLEALSAGGS